MAAGAAGHGDGKGVVKGVALTLSSGVGHGRHSPCSALHVPGPELKGSENKGTGELVEEVADTWARHSNLLSITRVRFYGQSCSWHLMLQVLVKAKGPMINGLKDI